MNAAFIVPPTDTAAAAAPPASSVSRYFPVLWFRAVETRELLSEAKNAGRGGVADVLQNDDRRVATTYETLGGDDGVP